jgi:hypothetical protein
MKLEQPPTNEQHTTEWRTTTGTNKATRAFLGIPFLRSGDHLLLVLPFVPSTMHYLSSAQVGW